MEISKEADDFDIYFRITNGYQVRIYPEESGLALKERIYEYFFDYVYPTMDAEDQNAIDWDRDHSIERIEQGENIKSEWEQKVQSAFGTSKILCSWCLSRLWYLTRGKIQSAVEALYLEGEPSTDGGDLYISLLIEKEKVPLAVLTLYGSAESGFLSFNMLDWSPTLSISESLQIYQSFSEWMLSDVKQISACKITIKDPEFSSFPWEYGYDGKSFLRRGQASVLAWYDTLEDKHLSELVNKAIHLLEEHPLHHLERDIRTEILIELTKYLIAYRANKIRMANSVHRFQMELEVLQKAAIIWKSVWPNETRIDEMVQTCKKLVCSTSSQQREQLILKCEEHREYVRNWIHSTWMQSVDHKRHYYSAGLAGVCVEKAMKEIDTKLEYYDNLAFDEQPVQQPSDKDLPEELWNEDMYFYAACVAAEGLPYKMEGYPIGKPEKFYEYWKWWLLEAIPRSI